MLAIRTTAESFQFSATPPEAPRPVPRKPVLNRSGYDRQYRYGAARRGLGDLAPSAPIVVLGFATGIALGTVLLMLPVA